MSTSHYAVTVTNQWFVAACVVMKCHSHLVTVPHARKEIPQTHILVRLYIHSAALQLR